MNVKPHLLKTVGILTLKAIHPYPDTVAVGIPDRTARIASRLGIDTRLQSQRMNIVGNPLHSVGKTFGMRMEHSLLITPAEKAVIDVYKTIPSLLQSLTDHGIG